MEPNYTVADAKTYASRLVQANLEKSCQGSVEGKLAIMFAELQNMFGEATSVKISRESLEKNVKALCKLVTEEESREKQSSRSSSSKTKSSKKKRKEILLHQIVEETPSNDDNSCEIDGDVIGNKNYSSIVKKLHKNLSSMKIGRQSKGSFLKSPAKLQDLLDDILALKAGDYYLID